jgi:cytochrome b561
VARGYGIVARLFHWGSALLILATVVIGVAMTSEGFESLRDALYVSHKTIGVVILGVLALRVAWRVVTPGPPRLPDSVPPLQRRLAEVTHTGLYLLMGLMAVTGYLRVVSGDFPVEILDAAGIPPLISGAPELSGTLSVVHKVGAYLLVAVVAMHVAAAAHHGLILRDGVFSRMWPPWRRDAAGEPEPPPVPKAGAGPVREAGSGPGSPARGNEPGGKP